MSASMIRRLVVGAALLVVFGLGPSATAATSAKRLPSVVTVARSQVRGAESRYTVGWGFTSGYWCAKFVSWVLAHAGVAVRSEVPAELARLTQPVAVPRPGDLVFLDTLPDNNGRDITHVGIVDSVGRDGAVRTIEGNADRSGRVVRRVRRGSEIVGYGRPPAATSTRVIPAPPPPKGCIWIRIGKPWLCP